MRAPTHRLRGPPRGQLRHDERIQGLGRKKKIAEGKAVRRELLLADIIDAAAGYCGLHGECIGALRCRCLRPACGMVRGCDAVWGEGTWQTRSLLKF